MLMSPTGKIGRFIETPLQDLTAEQRTVYQQLADGPRGKVPTPYKIWLSSPRMVTHLERLGVHLLREGALTPRETEIAILLSARQRDSEFVRAAHTIISRRIGMAERLIAALCNGDDPLLSDPRETLVYDLSLQLLDSVRIDDILFARAVNTIGHAGIAELSVLLGYYAAVAMTLDVYDVTAPQNN